MGRVPARALPGRHRRAALLAHRTQIDPDSHWMRVPDALIREAYPWDEYQLARSLVGEPAPGDTEDDLFAGLRDPERSEARVDTLRRR